MGKSKDLATGAAYQDQTESDTRYVNTAGDTMTGGLTVDAGNGNQLLLDNDGERFTQVSFKNNGSQYAAVWYDNSINVLVNHAASGKGYVVQTGGSTDRLVIDSSGRVTMPNQPAFYAYTTNDGQSSGTYLTSSSSSTNWSESFDNGGNFSDGVFTAPVAGKYYFSIMWNRRDVQSRIAIRKNNSNYMRWEPTGRTDDVWESQQYSVLINMAANDYVNLYLEYSGTSSYPAHMGTGAWGHFAGYLIC